MLSRVFETSSRPRDIFGARNCCLPGYISCSLEAIVFATVLHLSVRFLLEVLPVRCSLIDTTYAVQSREQLSQDSFVNLFFTLL